MNANSIKRKVYLEFLISHQLIIQKKYDYMTAKDDQLLTIVALAYANGKRLSVIDLLETVDIGSRSSVQQD